MTKAETPSRLRHLSMQPNSLLLSVMLRVGLTLFALMMLGCTVVVQPAKPPLYLAPKERPALVDEYGSFSKPGQAWLQELVNSYLRNCVTLKVLRGEDPQACQEGLR